VVIGYRFSLSFSSVQSRSKSKSQPRVCLRPRQELSSPLLPKFKSLFVSLCNLPVGPRAVHRRRRVPVNSYAPGLQTPDSGLWTRIPPSRVSRSALCGEETIRIAVHGVVPRCRSVAPFVFVPVVVLVLELVLEVVASSKTRSNEVPKQRSEYRNPASLSLTSCHCPRG
jgi:hypothetical protein